MQPWYTFLQSSSRVLILHPRAGDTQGTRALANDTTSLGLDRFRPLSVVATLKRDIGEDSPQTSANHLAGMFHMNRRKTNGHVLIVKLESYQPQV